MRTRNLILASPGGARRSRPARRNHRGPAETEQKLVVEGHHRARPAAHRAADPHRELLRSADASTFSNLFVRNAVVTVSDGITTLPLSQLCSSAIPDSLIDEVAELTGLDLTCWPQRTSACTARWTPRSSAWWAAPTTWTSRPKGRA